MTPTRACRCAFSATVLAASLLCGCSLGHDGPRVTEARSVAPFSRVTNHDAVDLRLRVGAPQRVRVRAGAEVISDVRTDVRDGMLHVRSDLDGFRDRSVVLEASLPRLTGIAAAGSGDVAAWGITSDEFELVSDGSGDVQLAGRTRRLSVRTEGSGDADLTELAAREAVVATDGSGVIAVRARERLDVRLDGSGDVRYFGAPQLSQLDTGSGEVEPRD